MFVNHFSFTTLLIYDKIREVNIMKKIILLILDGFGINNSDTGNAIKMANMPVLTKKMED